MPGQAFIVAWNFAVKAEHRRAFEHAYGPQGEWVQLFRTADGYIKTELYHDPENAAYYVTLDFWSSREQYEEFRQQAKSSYQAIDGRCERLTENEEFLGEFPSLSALQATLPRLRFRTPVASPPVVRAAHADDIAEIILIERLAPFAAHWTGEAYEAAFQPDAPPRIALVAETFKRLSGFVIARIAAGECELENIVVTPGDVRQGIGSTLLQELLEIARARGIQRILLEVRESNVAACRLYERFGFGCYGERRNYYRNPLEKAVLYSLAL